MLTFRFSGISGEMTESDALTSGMVGKQLLLEFSPEWDSLRKTVVFSNGSVVQDADPKGDKGDKGDPGAAYTLTDADRSDIAAAVKSLLSKEVWTFVLEDGSAVEKGVHLE